MFASFLRLSNIVAHSFSSLMFPNIWLEVISFVSDDMSIILIKCSKTIQFRDKIARIHIPMLPGLRLCLVTALKQMLALVPGSQNDPLFSI